MSLTRRKFVALSTTSLAAVGLVQEFSYLALLQARQLPVKIGVTDWNLDLEAKLGAVALARKLGFDGVEVSIGVGTDKLPLSSPELQEKYKAESKRLGLPIVSTCLEILHKNFLKSDPLGRRWVADAIPLTKSVGAHVILLPFFGKGALKTVPEMNFVADYLKEIAPEAEKAQVVLGLEDTISAEDNARMMDRAKSQAVKVYYDIGNSTRGKFDILKEIRWLGKDRICQFHLKDNPHYLGKGAINVPAVVDAIGEIGYSGWAVLETDSPTKNVEADLAVNLKYVRGLLA